jgi:hypothetical protein
MKTLKTLFLAASCFFALSCSEEVEKKGADFHARIADKSWSANEITVEATPQGERSEVKKLVAKADDGSSINISFELLGLTPEDLSASFRERTANLTSFTGSYDSNNGIVFLNWQTSSEENVDYFIIERSYDNFNFQQVDYMYGHGTTNLPNSYDTYYPEYSDQPYVYYRLFITDYWQSDYSYSPVLKIGLKVGVTFTDRFGRRFEGSDGEVTLAQYDSKARVLSGEFHFKYTDEDGVQRSVTGGHFEGVTY